MKYRFVLLVGPAIALARCVGGDDSSATDAGKDVTQQSDAASDVAQSDASTDAIVDVAPPPPTPDGSLVWLNHYNNNVFPGDTAFSDLAVNENGGLTYVAVGKFKTDPAAGNTYHFGTLNLGPATGTDVVSGGVNATGASVWATSATSNGSFDHYDSVAVDGQGNLYVLGGTDGTSIKFKNTLTGPTTFVAKLTATGTPLWEHAYSSTSTGGPISGPSHLVLSGTQVLVAMTFIDDITYDSGMTYNTASDAGFSQADVFVAALDPATGATKWSGVYGNPTFSDSASAMAPTSDGSVILAGNMGGVMNAVTGITGSAFPLSPNGDGSAGADAYVLKIDATGKATYGLVYGEATSIVPNGVAYSNGTIALAMQFSGSVDFGKGTIASQNIDGVVFTIDETTKKTGFVAQLTGAATDLFRSVALDPWNEVIAAGTYGDTNASAQIGAQALPQTSFGVGGMVLAKWDPKGTLLWAHGFVPTLDGGAPPYSAFDVYNVHQNITPYRVLTTSTGQVVVTGVMTGGSDFGKGYSGQLSTFQNTKCTCAICNALCYVGNPPLCCNTPIPGNAGDGIMGVWLP